MAFPSIELPGPPDMSDETPELPNQAEDAGRARRGAIVFAALAVVTASIVAIVRPPGAGPQLVLLGFPLVAGLAAWMVASVRRRSGAMAERSTPDVLPGWFAAQVPWADVRRVVAAVATFFIVFSGLLLGITDANGWDVSVESDEAVEIGFLVAVAAAVIAMHEFGWRGVLQPLVEVWVSRPVAVVASALLSAAWWAVVVDETALTDGGYLVAFVVIAALAAGLARGSVLQRTVVGALVHTSLVIGGVLALRVAVLDDGATIVLVAAAGATAAATAGWLVQRWRARHAAA